MRVAIWSTAVTVLAALSALFLFQSAPLALADVIKAAEKHKLVKYTFTQQPELKSGGAISPSVQTVYADLKATRFRASGPAGFKLAEGVEIEGDYSFIGDAAKKLLIRINREELTAKAKNDPEAIKLLEKFGIKDKFPRKDVAIYDYQGDFLSITSATKSVLENIRDLETHKDVVATKGKLDGKDVLKYRIETEHTTTLLCVDAATKLPVKLEREMTDPKQLHPDFTKHTETMTDFEWDPKLKEFKSLDELFDTTLPKGYKVDDQRKKKD